jgi:hypothetical protein
MLGRTRVYAPIRQRFAAGQKAPVLSAGRRRGRLVGHSGESSVSRKTVFLGQPDYGFSAPKLTGIKQQCSIGKLIDGAQSTLRTASTIE